MTQSSKLCNHCFLCDCPKLDGFAKVDYCKKTNSSEIYTLLLVQLQFSTEDITPSREVCNYQARVKVFGNTGDESDSDEKSLIKFSNENVPSECETEEDKYSFIYDFKFLWEDNELDQEKLCSKNLYTTGAYSDITIEVEIFSLVPDNTEQENFECESYGPLYIECETEEETESESTTEDSTEEECTCKWNSDDDTGYPVQYSDTWWNESDEYGDQAEPVGGRDNICRYPPCFPCGHLPVVGRSCGHLYKEEESDGTHHKVKILFDSTFGDVKQALLLKVDIEIYTQDGTLLTKLEDLDYVTSNSRIILDSVVYWGNVDASGEVVVDLTGLVNYEEHKDKKLFAKVVPKEECECECVFGRKRANEEIDIYSEYVLENHINTDLISNSNNYHNVEFTVGNCLNKKTPPVSATSDGIGDSEATSVEDLNYWIRYKVTLSNILSNKFGHNCLYSGAKLKWYIDSNVIHTIDLSDKLYGDGGVDLVRDLEDESVVDTRNDMKVELVNDTIIVTDIIDDTTKELFSSGSELNIDTNYVELCVDTGTTSHEDGYSEGGVSYNYSNCDNCCQKYKINNMCIESPTKCVPCAEEEKISCEFIDKNKEDEQCVELHTNIQGPVLGALSFELNGGTHEFLIAAAEGEDVNHIYQLNVEQETSGNVQICCNKTSDDESDST